MSDPTKKNTGGSLTVVVALGANLLVAVAKTIASVLTGSASMVAEAAHSWADFGNEIFLLIADRRSVSSRPAQSCRSCTAISSCSRSKKMPTSS
jgi:divalent metal cation (Fe/Co/Zn/Cd) transporter